MHSVAPSNLKMRDSSTRNLKNHPNRRGSMFSLTNIHEHDSQREFNSRLSFSEGAPAFIEKKKQKFENSYVMEPEYNSKFFGPDLRPRTEEIKEIAKVCLENFLAGEEYDPLVARELGKSLSDEIKKRVQLLDDFPSRYKVMVMVFVGQMSENLEMRIASRMMGLKYDTWCDASFVGKNIWGSAQVYLVYQE